MAMEINNAYYGYGNTSTYTAKTDNQKKTGEETKVTAKKTADDELSYLSGKYDDISFIAANYTQGMRYGTNATTNVAISPSFLKKMANDPELEKEYESYFKDMQRLDAENIRTHEARGRHMVAQGWAIDQNGDISRWGISEPTNKRRYGQEMTDYGNKLRREKAEKEKEQERITEKREERKEEQKDLDAEMDMHAREVFGDKFKGSVMEYRNTAQSNEEQENIITIGSNLDLKL